MSDFKFFCPECGQKIVCDASAVGAQISCPTCQKSLTVPASSQLVPASMAAPVPTTAPAPPPVPIAPPPVPQTAAPRVPSATAPAKPLSAPPGRYSGLAMASLICSVFVPFGFVAGLICGHIAKARMRKDIFLEGEKMANAGLIISYCVLLATLFGGITWLGVRWHFHPVHTVRQSADAVAAPSYRVVDEIVIDETEEDHEMEGRMTGKSVVAGKTGRTASRGGGFSYTMRVLPNEDMSLNCRYWGSEHKGHTFDIAVDGQIISTVALNMDAPEKFFDVEYKIPSSLTRGKDSVTVEFQAHPNLVAGALYGCQMLKR